MKSHMFRRLAAVSTLIIVGVVGTRSQTLTSPVTILPSAVMPIPPSPPNPTPSIWSYDWTGVSRPCSPPYFEQQLFFGSAMTTAQLGATAWGIECNGKIFSNFSDTNDVVLNATHARNLILTNRTQNMAVRIGTTPAGSANDIERVTVLASGLVGISNSNPHDLLELGDGFTFGSGGWKDIAFNQYWNASVGAARRIHNGNASTIAFTDKGMLRFESYPYASTTSPIDSGMFVELDTFRCRLWSDHEGEMVDFERSRTGNSGGAYFKHKLYIGTKDPGLTPLGSEFMFAVNGAAKAKEVIVDTSSFTAWPDYVFSDDYKLMDLPSLAKWVHTNKHLPGIPSSDEISRNGGISIGAMQAKAIEKIEELTLYVVELEKRNHQLEMRLDELERKCNKKSQGE